MNKLKKILKVIFKIVVWGFAAFGFVLSFSYLAIVKQWTNESGSIDINNRKFEEVSTSTTKKDKDSAAIHPVDAAFISYKLMVLNRYYPKNATVIINVLQKSGDFELANKMIQAVNIKTFDSLNLDVEFNRNRQIFEYYYKSSSHSKNAFDWIDLSEWQVLKEAIRKDKNLIDSAASLIGIEPRLITMVLIGEQIRLFNSNREIYKNALMPLKILSISNKISYGVTGIKDFTAKDVELNLKDATSPFYLGKKYENFIQFKTENHDEERMSNLVNYKNHYYSYLYAGLILKQIREQWKKAGYDISNRPEILATLFNVGFRYSKPKSNPIVGGSHVEVGGKDYTFGGISFEFYYSGELTDIFPYHNEKWKDNI